MCTDLISLYKYVEIMENKFVRHTAYLLRTSVFMLVTKLSISST